MVSPLQPPAGRPRATRHPRHRNRPAPLRRLPARRL